MLYFCVILRFCRGKKVYFFTVLKFLVSLHSFRKENFKITLSKILCLIKHS